MVGGLLAEADKVFRSREVPCPGGCLMNAPRDIGAGKGDAEVASPGKNIAPKLRIKPPIMNGTADQISFLALIKQAIVA